MKMRRKGIVSLAAGVILSVLVFFSPALGDHFTDHLTPAEQQWLKAHPRVRVGIGVAFPPFMWVEKQGDLRRFRGMVSDYLELLEARLGIEMEIVHDIPFSEALARAKNKELDFLPCLSSTPERSAFLSFTQPYLSYPVVVVTQSSNRDIKGIEDLHDKRLAVVKHLAVYSKLTNDYKEIDFQYVETSRVDENLEAVSLGVADACIINLAAASHYIEKKGLTNLKVAAYLDWEGLHLSMGVRKDWPIFLGIVEKAMADIPPEAHEQIRSKWVFLDGQGMDTAVVVRWGLGIGAAVLLLFIGVVAWNWRLKHVILEKERAESKLRQSREVLKNLIGNLPGVAYRCISDKDWTMQYISEGCLALTGYGPSDLIENQQLAYADLIHPEDRDYVAREVEAALARDSYFTLEYRIVDRDGLSKWVWERGRAAGRDDAGQTILEGFIQDISKRKKAEKAFRESRETLLEAQRMTRTGSWEWDAESRVVTCSREMCKIFELDEERSVVDPDVILDRIHPEDLQMVNHILDQAFEGRPRYKIRFRISLPRGGVRHIQGIGRVSYNAEGRPVRIRGSNQDITDRVTGEQEKEILESQLRHAHKMEAVGTLAGGIAHEFNNILGIILGNAELAMDEAGLGKETGESLKEICNASLRGRDVVRQLLSFARSSDPKPKKPVDVAALVQEVVGLLRAYIPSNVRFRTELPDRDATIMADPTQLHQLMINLCNNAAQAMAAGGEIEILLVHTRILDREIFMDQVLMPGAYLRLSVRDTGCGISPDNLKKVFHPFYTTKEVDQGSGMGLAVVYGIVREHGGVITIKSELDQGTTIDCFFPPAPEPGGTSAETRETEHPLLLGNESVIFVDDEPGLVETGTRQLEKLGYRVAAFTDPKEALAAFESAPDRYDLILTDFTMPGMTGDRLVEGIKAVRPKVPCIICSGYSERIDADNPEQMGAAAFIMKPADLLTLSRTLRQVLDRSTGSTADPSGDPGPS